MECSFTFSGEVTFQVKFRKFPAMLAWAPVSWFSTLNVKELLSEALTVMNATS